MATTQVNVTRAGYSLDKSDRGGFYTFPNPEIPILQAWRRLGVSSTHLSVGEPGLGEGGEVGPYRESSFPDLGRGDQAVFLNLSEYSMVFSARHGRFYNERFIGGPDGEAALPISGVLLLSVGVNKKPWLLAAS